MFFGKIVATKQSNQLVARTRYDPVGKRQDIFGCVYVQYNQSFTFTAVRFMTDKCAEERYVCTLTNIKRSYNERPQAVVIEGQQKTGSGSSLRALWPETMR